MQEPRPILPSAYDRDHPFNAWAARLVWPALFLLVGLVILMQWFSGDLLGRRTLQAPAEVRASEEVRDPGVGELAVSSKLIVKRVNSGFLRPGGADITEEEFATDVKEFAAGAEWEAVTRTERLRLAIVLAELGLEQEAADRLEEVASESTSGSTLAAEARALHAYYAAAASGSMGVLASDVRDGLEVRHGWFGRLALAYALPVKDPFRTSVVRGGRELASVTLVSIGLGVVSFLAGCVLVVIALSRARAEGWETEISQTSVAGTVYAEAVVAFLTLFVTVLALRVLLVGQEGSFAFVLQEGGVWLAAGAVFWPVLRGVRPGAMWLDYGWETGQGVLAEAAIGVGAFMASAPVVLVVSIVAGMLETVLLGTHEVNAGVPMFREPLGDTWTAVVMGAISACVWAPLVEETLFRGALHRWMPHWLGVVGRVALSSLMFGLVHPYSPAGMASVAAAGAVYGLLREWRGSVIAGVVAHALHNGAITGVQIAILAIIE